MLTGPDAGGNVYPANEQNPVIGTCFPPCEVRDPQWISGKNNGSCLPVTLDQHRSLTDGKGRFLPVYLEAIVAELALVSWY